MQKTNNQTPDRLKKERVLVDIENSYVYWKGFKPGDSHSGLVKFADGTVNVINDSIYEGSFKIDMRTIEDSDLADEILNNTLVEHLKGPDFFDVDKFPFAEFNINHVDLSGINPYKLFIKGDLTIKNIAKEISFTVNGNFENNIYKIHSESLVIDRTDWDLTYGSSKMLKIIENNIILDNIELQIFI